MKWGLLYFHYAALGILLSTAGQTLLVQWAPWLLQADISPPSPALVTVPPLSASLLTPAACACAAPAALCPWHHPEPRGGQTMKHMQVDRRVFMNSAEPSGSV